MKNFLERSLFSNRPGLFLLNLLALVGVGITFHQTNYQLASIVQQEIQAQQTVESLQQALILITDAETGQREYSFTRQEGFLEPYYAALTNLDSTLNTLQSRVAPDPEQQKRLEQLQRLIKQRLALLQEAVDLQRKKFDLNAQIRLSERGKQVHDQIRKTISMMLDREKQRFQQLATESQIQSHISTGSLFAGIGFSLFLFTRTYGLLDRQIKLQQQQSSTTLAQNEEKLRLALEAAQIGMWDWDLKSGEVTWSNEHAQLFGLDPRTFDGRYTSFDSYIHPDDRIGLNQTVQAALNNRRSYQHEFRVIWPDRSIHWIEGRGHALYSGEGQPFRMLGTVMNIDDRKRAEELLRLSERRYATLAITAPVGIFRTTPHGACIYVNERWCEMAGFSTEEALGTGWAKALHPEDRDRVVAAWYEAARARSIFRLEYRFQRPDSSVIWVFGQAMAESTAEGQVLGYVGTITDISDRKQAEVELQESEMRFHALVDAMFEGIMIQENGLIIDANPGLAKMFGYSVEEILGKSIVSFLTPETAAIAMNYIKIHYELPYEITGIRKDGSLINVEVVGKQTLYQGRQVRVAALRDITAQKQAEAVIYQLNQELEARVAERTAELQAAIAEVEDLYNRAPCGYHSLDPDGYFVQINQTELDWLGYTHEEVLHRKKFSDLLTPASFKAFQTNFPIFLQQGYVNDLEYQIVRKDGSIVDVSINAIAIRDEQGKILMNRATMINICDRKRIQVEQQRVARMKDEFVSVVSHELRTPLTAIYGALNLLSAGTVAPGSAQGQRVIHIATENAERLVNLVNDILDLERLESGKIGLKKQPCNVPSLLNTAVTLNQLLADRAGITLEVSAAEVEVIADRDRILQVLTNLLTNAIKFSPSGSVITLQAESTAPTTHPSIHSSTYPPIRFNVTDQGRGIPADKLESIFERFQQVDASDSRKAGGTGLGLAICRSIIYQHGGQIWAESTVGKGSCFYFTIPGEGE